MELVGFSEGCFVSFYGAMEGYLNWVGYPFELHTICCLEQYEGEFLESSLVLGGDWKLPMLLLIALRIKRCGYY